MTADTRNSGTAINHRGRAALPSIAVKFEHDGQHYNAKFSRHDDGRVAEIYLDGGPVSHTAARLVSLCLSAGVDLVTVRRAVIGGAMGVLLDMILEFPGRPDAAEGSKGDDR